MDIKADAEFQKLLALTAISEIEALRGSKVFCLYNDQRPDTDDSIDGRLVINARRASRILGQFDKITLLLESPGGSPDHAYRLLNILRRHCKELEVVVVGWSKSAATFLCLGADKICMSDDAELGPLDVQIRDPKGGRRISALNAFKSLEFLREHLIETYESTVRFNAEAYGMDLSHSIACTTPLVGNLVQPLFSQLDIMELGQARRELAVGEEYSRRVMERYSYTDFPVEKINDIVRQLVWNYPSHGFVIDRTEAETLGLKVEKLEDDCANLFYKVLGNVHSCVGVISDEDQKRLDKFFQQIVASKADIAESHNNEESVDDKNGEDTDNAHTNGQELPGDGSTASAEQYIKNQGHHQGNVREVNGKKTVEPTG